VTPRFAVKLPPVVEIGAGVTDGLAGHARRLGLRRVLVVTDPWLHANGPVAEIAGRLQDAGIAAAVHDGVQPDPTTDDVRAGVRVAREHEAEGVVAVGGGSPIDAAKAIAVMAGRECRDIAEYAGYDRIGGDGLPLIAIPTTAGSGSEQTRATVIADHARHLKLAIYDDALLPRVALVDPLHSLSQPRQLTAHVGIDALVHAVEAYVSRLATPVSDVLALGAARLIWPNLRAAFRDPSDEPARAAMMLGASLAGAAFSNSSVCLVHGMSRPIGAHFHVPHGLSNAVLFAAVTAFSIEAAPDRYAALARALGAAPEGAGDDLAADALVSELDALVHDLEIPGLRELDVAPDAYEAALEAMAQAALASGSPDFNPRRPSEQDIVDLYRDVY
jgi:alcohol dehydrogenase class IV